MTTKELTCIRCPLGCMLTASLREDGSVAEVSGNTCPRGAEYAKKELQNPTRMLTSTVAVRHGELPRVSVKTASDIPKERIFDCMKVIQSLQVTAPVRMGEVLMEDIAGTGVALVATKTVEGQNQDLGLHG